MEIKGKIVFVIIDASRLPPTTDTPSVAPKIALKRCCPSCPTISGTSDIMDTRYMPWNRAMKKSSAARDDTASALPASAKKMSVRPENLLNRGTARDRAELA
ncbi:hypothetical protein BUAM107266_29350 [Burkholderia ambifaria]